MPDIDLSCIHALLGPIVHHRVERLRFIGSGMFSRAYAFSAGQEEYVLRLNACEGDFRKDQLAAIQWSSPSLPIPAMMALGRFNASLQYAITRRAAGQTFASISLEQRRRLIPALFAAVDRLRQIDVSPYTGWGLSDSAGNGRYASWSGYLTAQYNQKFDFNWNRLASHHFFEMDLYRTFQARMHSLLPFVPALRHVVHGDIGGGNMLAIGDRITGVIDWAEARLGDFLFDIAYLDYWSDDIPYGRLWKQHADAIGLQMPYFKERMRCYKLHIGMDSMAIAAELDDIKEYGDACLRTWQACSETEQ